MDRLKELSVLFLEDNQRFAKNTSEFLNIYFHNVYHATTIKKAIDIFESTGIDVIISDIKVSDGNGLHFIEKIRELDTTIPIVILSAHKDEDFLFKAIPLNITSYELKPVNYDKFMEILKKIKSKFETVSTIELSNEISYNFKTKTLLKQNSIIKLSKKEIIFIELLLKNKDEVITKDMIQNNVWMEEFMSEAALKNLIFRLRKKIDKKFIITMPDLGYKISFDH